ncbi:CTP synthetase [Roseovarius faecimaris]|uniref:CTP synthetase n=1 Tax=Roseovarius faecimaris TaxID=2494550 RepID=A0A6I6ITQ7_9RHOB|nr:CTP synthetase [Roseovarius faecimaris]QGX99161.1 CTP synthetase [Roseovarius faecimaris]
MVRLSLILHLFIGSTLGGMGIVAALVLGYGTLFPILAGGLAGFLAAFPVSYVIAKKLYES